MRSFGRLQSSAAMTHWGATVAASGLRTQYDLRAFTGISADEVARFITQQLGRPTRDTESMLTSGLPTLIEAAATYERMSRQRSRSKT